MGDWPKYENPPIIAAILEVRFEYPGAIDIKSLKASDDIVKDYPIREDKIHGNINLPPPSLGITSAQVSTQHIGYTYASEDKLRKVVISKQNILYIQEGLYSGWPDFNKRAMKSLGYFEHFLNKSEINRVSMRFINRFKFKDFTNTLDYFNTSISAKVDVISYPVDSYFFRYSFHIPETLITANVIQSHVQDSDNEVTSIFDIDVLDNSHFVFDSDILLAKLEVLRDSKNRVFFNNLTEKTLRTYETK